MLKITRRQLDHLRETNISGFEKQMVRHLGERFPLRCTALGPPGVLRVVQKGTSSAALRGITREKDVCRLIELLCALGEGLDAEPDHEWVTAVLEQANPQNFSARLEQLGKLASERLNAAPAASPDPALRREAAHALTRTGAPSERFNGRAVVGDPVMPCPGPPARKRCCSFSS